MGKRADELLGFRALLAVGGLPPVAPRARLVEEKMGSFPKCQNPRVTGSQRTSASTTRRTAGTTSRASTFSPSPRPDLATGTPCTSGDATPSGTGCPATRSGMRPYAPVRLESTR